MKHAKHLVDRARQILGRNEHWVIIPRVDSPALQRWRWNCGCIVECARDARVDQDVGFHWDRCGGHRDAVMAD